MLVFGALPLFFMELALGQFAKAGPISLWTKICPAFKGVGYCCVLISWYVRLIPLPIAAVSFTLTQVRLVLLQRHHRMDSVLYHRHTHVRLEPQAQHVTQMPLFR